MTISPINIEQEAHVKRLKYIAENGNNVLLDLSKMGAGKTFHANMLSRHFKLNMVVVCPANLREKWKYVSAKNKCKIIVISYEELRGTVRLTGDKGKKPIKVQNENDIPQSHETISCLPHLMLERTDRIDYIMTKTQDEQFIAEPVHSVTYKPTEMWNKCSKMLLVVDEIQLIKNDSSNTRAVEALISYIVHQNGSSKALLMSGSPVDKTEHIFRLMKTIGIVQKNHLVDLCIQPNEPIIKYGEDMERVENMCLKLNKELTEIIKKEYIFENQLISPLFLPINSPIVYDEYMKLNIARLVHKQKGNQGHDEKAVERFCKNLKVKNIISQSGKKVLHDSLKNYCYSLFVKIIMPGISSSCKQMDRPIKISLVNAFFKIPNRNVEDIMNSTNNILEVVKKRDNREVTQNDSIKCITKHLQVIEFAKIDLIVRLVRQILNSHSTMKVLIGANYTHTLNEVKRLLDEDQKHGEIVLIDGKVKMTDRVQLIEKFQKPDTNCRVAIGNLRTISTGNDFDDQHGNFPRTALILPNYETITQYQFAGRIMRTVTRSDATLLTLYAHTDIRNQKEVPQNSEEYRNYPIRSNVFEIVKNARSIESNDENENNTETYMLSVLAKKSNIISDTTGNASNNMLSGIAPHWIE
jgi:hypothetical protein